MATPAQNYVTLVEALEMLCPYEEFVVVLAAAITRLEREGVRELVGIHFFAQPGSTEVGALLTFSDPARMIDHINLIGQWEEFKEFFRVAKPLDVRIYGQLSAEAEAWVRQFGVVSKVFEHHVAGFVR
jgi:hypothetical protein